MNIDFDKIYVIQSLSKEDSMTGEHLYDDVLQHFSAKKAVELIYVKTPAEFFTALDRIKTECETGNLRPIIHFEIHGLENRTGLSLSDGDIVWSDLYESLQQINAASEWNLFVTMAVCYGNYAMLLIQPTKPAPFTGILGSFETIYEDDLYLRYTAFYLELLTSLDFEKALEKLHASNPGLPSDYRYIDAEKTFKNVYQKYLDTQFSEEIIKSRYRDALKKEGLKTNDREQMHRFGIRFKSILLRTKREQYEQDKSTFFMLDQFPEHQYIYCVGWEPNY